MESVQKQLEGIGLTENEVKVYMASLEVGAATAQQLAAKAAVVRPTAYVAIGGLVKRGLMSSHTRGKKQFFQAERPTQLLRLVEEEKKKLADRESKLKSLLPGLESLISMAGEKPEVKYYEGVEGLQALRECLFSSKAKEILIVGSVDNFSHSVPNDSTVSHVKRIEKAGIIGRQIVISKKYNKKDIVHFPKNWKLKVIKAEQQGDCSELSCFGDYVSIITYIDQPYGILLRSKTIANTVRFLLNTTWPNV